MASNAFSVAIRASRDYRREFVQIRFEREENFVKIRWIKVASGSCICNRGNCEFKNVASVGYSVDWRKASLDNTRLLAERRRPPCELKQRTGIELYKRKCIHSRMQMDAFEFITVAEVAKTSATRFGLRIINLCNRVARPESSKGVRI